MKLYHSGQYHVASNTLYPHELNVETVEQILQAIRYDHVAAKYRDSRRSVENFMESDCIMMDVDNAPGKGQPDIPPSEWVDLDRIRADLSDVKFYAVTSRSHMKEKDGRPARPKYHIYFPILSTTDATAYAGIKAGLQARLPYFDANAKDAARFFYGNDAASAWFYDGTRLVTDWLLDQMLQEPTPAPQPQISRPAQAVSAAAQGNEARIRDALDAIPCGSVDRDEWIRVGMALHSLGWPDGLDIWDAWSSSDSARYKPGECARKWRGFKAGTIDHTYLIHLAQRYGWRPQKPQPMKEEPMKETKTEETVAEQPKIHYVDVLLQDFQTRRYEPIPTGIQEIDKIIDGGFIRQTIVLLSAAPGFGKTVLAQQIFENVAKEGRADVLYLNMEMSREQLIARSLSRATKYNVTKIMRGYEWSDTDRAIIESAAETYKKTTAPHLVYEGGTDQNATSYQSIEARMKEAYNKRQDQQIPFIVVIDYLQLLTSTEPREDGVDVIKRALKRFKDFAVEHNAVVFLIVAQSRSLNESGKVTPGAGRDTSAAEYSADLQLQLNYTEIATGWCKDIDEMRNKIKRGELKKDTWNSISLTCTKHRFGPKNRVCIMKFDGEHSVFIPESSQVDVDDLLIEQGKREQAEKKTSEGKQIPMNFRKTKKKTEE